MSLNIGYFAGVPPMDQIMRQAKKALTERREALMRIWRQTSDEERQVSGTVEADWTETASDNEAAKVLHVLSDKERREFEEIEAALARLAVGTYGSCVQCGR